MPKILVSSLGHTEEAFLAHKPSHVVSILDVDEPTPPAFASLPPENHVKLIENCSKARDCETPDDVARCKKLIDLAKRWDKKAPILIHCHRGVARSMAAAYILLCAVEDKTCERKIADRLRKAAPHADPNLLLISEADALLGREDRMVEAVLDLCPCSGAIADPVVILPVEA